MKRLLLTLTVLCMAVSAFAECSMYIEDFELKRSELGTEIVVPIKAHFSARVSGWEVELSYPDGLTASFVDSGSDMAINYFNKNGERRTAYAALYGAYEPYRHFLATTAESGYWQDPNGEDPNAWVSYGSVKWEAGDYDEMILLNLKPSVDFAGGDINITFSAYAGNDTRGGTVIDNGDNGKVFSSVCHITVKDDEEEKALTVCDDHYTNGYVPVYGYYYDEAGAKCQMIYPAEMLTAMKSGKITQLKFYAEGQISFSGGSLELSLKKVDEIGFTEFVAITGAHPVASIVPSSGLTELVFDLDEPFEYTDGNLLVETLVLAPGAYGRTYFRGAGTDYNSSLYRYGNYSGSLVKFLPKATFTYTGGAGSGQEIEQSAPPLISGYDSENGYVVSITPSEDSDIYYRIIKNHNEYGEWTLYTGELLFNEPGSYRIESYAKAEGKTASDVMAYEFVVQGLPQTDPPVISYSLTDEAVNVTATGAGDVKLYKDGIEVENPCTITRTSVDQTFTFSATAKEDGKLISETTTLQVDVPAKEVEPGEVYKPENVTVVPSTTTADVSWMDVHNNGWNLRFREVLPGIDSNLLWDFEVDTNDNADTSLPGGWTSIDADGDGREWYHLNDTPNYDYVNHSGIGHVTSASYVHTTDSTGLALTPDNWLVSPRVKIDGELSFWACGQDPNWASEVFRVYTSTDKVNWVPISDDITATGEMTKYTFDLTPYACQNGYVAIRHYNVTDMFRLNIDDIAITYIKPAEWIYVNFLDEPYYTIFGLNPGTCYEVQVQGINSSEMTSEWTESVVFTTSVLLGDANGDGMVNIADLNEMLSIIFYDGAFVVAADMNKDGIINVQDVVGLVHYLLNGEIPSISSNGRGIPKAETVGQASLYWQDGVLYMNSDVPVSALNMINDVGGDITWNLDDYGMVVMQESGASGEHAVIFSFDRNVIPSGVTAIATTNSQTPRVVGAELSTLDSKLILVTLNDQITGLTSVQAAGEINCYMDGSNLVINNNDVLRDLDISVYTFDGRTVANHHLSLLDSGQTSIEMNDIIKSNRYLILVVRNGRQILATLKLTQNR